MGTASQMLAAGAILAVGSLVRGEPLAVPSARAAGALAYLVVLGSLLAYSAFGWLLKNARPALATSYAYVNPVMALALGVAFGGERFTPVDGAGLVLVLAAVGAGWGGRSGAGRRDRAGPDLDGDAVTLAKPQGMVTSTGVDHADWSCARTRANRTHILAPLVPTSVRDFPVPGSDAQVSAPTGSGLHSAT